MFTAAVVTGDGVGGHHGGGRRHGRQGRQGGQRGAGGSRGGVGLRQRLGRTHGGGGGGIFDTGFESDNAGPVTHSILLALTSKDR